MSMIQYRIIESAPLPEKPKKERKARQKYDFAAIPVGGAAAFPIGDADPKKLKLSIYNASRTFAKANDGFKFKISIEQDGTEIWVRRLAGEGDSGAPAAEASPSAVQSNAETLSNGSYDYSSIAAE